MFLRKPPRTGRRKRDEGDHREESVVVLFANPGWVKRLAWNVAVVIAALNAWLLYQTLAGILG